VANERESKRWNDDRWTASWPNRERLTDVLSPYVLQSAGARPGQRVCDIGCGGGALAVALAQAVRPGGRVVGIDFSAPLLELARSRAADAGVGNADFVVKDVQTDSLGQDPFEVAVSQLGVMFFDEPLAAFAAIRGLLVSGGRFVFACWQGVEDNPWHTGSALRSLVPPPPVPPPGKSPVGPFAFGDDEYVRDVLSGAGFGPVESQAHATTVRAPSSAVVDRSLLPFMGVAPERRGEAEALVERHLERFAVAPGEYEFPLAFRVYEAVNG
jgi:SAM-dependent methyltransferase